MTMKTFCLIIVINWIIDYPMKRDVDVDFELIIDEKLHDLDFYVEIKYYDVLNNIWDVLHNYMLAIIVKCMSCGLLV